MTRQTAANFAGGLQFPYATAATDLFKKEDVQVLAQAVDQHDHSAGRGAVLADGAATALVGTYQSTPSFSTTTTGIYLNTPVLVTGTTSGGRLWIGCAFTISHSGGPGSVVTSAITRAGSILYGSALSVYSSALAGEAKSFFVQLYEMAPAGTYTWQLQLNNNSAGTLALSGSVLATLHVWEFKR